MRKISFGVFVMTIGIVVALAGASTSNAARYLTMTEKQELRAGALHDCHVVINQTQNCDVCLSLGNNQWGYCTEPHSDQACDPWTGGPPTKQTCEDDGTPNCGGTLKKYSAAGCPGASMIGMGGCDRTYVKKLGDGVPGQCPPP